MKFNYEIFDQLFNIISSSAYLYFAIVQWQKVTDQDQRIMVCIFTILLIGVFKSVIIFRICFNSFTRLDFHITIMYVIVHLINCSSKNSIFKIDFDFSSQNLQLTISYALFYCILLLNGIYFSVIGFAILIIAVVSLVQIWYSSDSIINREGLSSQEFESLPSKIITAKDADKMKSSQHSGIHNHSSNECAICLSFFEQNEVMIEMIQCKHVFHSECIKVWFKNSILCPYCRNDIRKALQKIKREKHQLQHGGHTILDKIVNQAEPSFQLEEFIEQNDLRVQLEQPQIIQQQQQFQDNNQNQIHDQINHHNQVNVNNIAAGGRNSPQIFQNNLQLIDEINQNPPSQQQNHPIFPQNITGQNNHGRIYQASPRFPLTDEILSQSQSQSIQPLLSNRNQNSLQQQMFVNQIQQQEQIQQQPQQQQQQRSPIRIVEPPSPRQQKLQRHQSSHHSRQNSFGSDDNKFLDQLQQQHQSFQLQLKNSASNQSPQNSHTEMNNLNYYADGAGYSNHKNILDDFSFYDEQKEINQIQKTEKL